MDHSRPYDPTVFHAPNLSELQWAKAILDQNAAAGQAAKRKRDEQVHAARNANPAACSGGGLL